MTTSVRGHGPTTMPRMAWPEDWDQLHSGATCPMCAEGRPETTPFGIRVLAGRYSDAYLARRAPQRGYVFVVWRGRHVTEPMDLTDEEAVGYWREVLRVAGAVRSHFAARKVNYETLGNSIPHLHTHITARYAKGDVAPGGPLPKDRDRPRPDAEMDADARALRGLLQR